jgi:hypothetical protein
VSGYEAVQGRARKIADFLCRPENVGKRIKRDALASRLSTATVTFSPASVTALWPLVEVYVREIGAERGLAFYANRPTYKSGYAVAVTTTPHAAMRAAVEREKNVVSRLSKDLTEGSILYALAECGERHIERRAQRRIDRSEMYLDAYKRHEADLDALIADIDAMWADLEWIA